MAPDNEHLTNPADIPTVQPKFVKIVDQWASRSSGGGGGAGNNGDSNLHVNQRARESSLGVGGDKKKKYEMSSTSNIHLDDSTVSKPNLKAMLKCLGEDNDALSPKLINISALAIYFHINKKRKDDYDEEDEEDNIPEIFDERIYPLSKDKQKKVRDYIALNSIYIYVENSMTTTSARPTTKKCTSLCARYSSRLSSPPRW